MPVIVIFFYLLSVCCMVVPGIWLICLGKLFFVLTCIAFGAFSPMLFALLLSPAMAVTWIEGRIGDRSSRCARFSLSFTNLLLIYAITLLWCCAALYYFNSKSDSASFIPMLVWGYFLAIYPCVKASQMDETDASAHVALFVFLGNSAALCALLIFKAPMVIALSLLAVTMLIGFVMHLLVKPKMERSSLSEDGQEH
jgi:hypothetical protein